MIIAFVLFMSFFGAALLLLFVLPVSLERARKKRIKSENAARLALSKKLQEIMKAKGVGR